MSTKKRRPRNIVVLIITALAAVAVGVVTFNLDKIMKAIWEFRDGFIGVPRAKIGK